MPSRSRSRERPVGNGAKPPGKDPIAAPDRQPKSVERQTGTHRPTASRKLCQLRQVPTVACVTHRQSHTGSAGSHPGRGSGIDHAIARETILATGDERRRENGKSLRSARRAAQETVGAIAPEIGGVIARRTRTRREGASETAPRTDTVGETAPGRETGNTATNQKRLAGLTRPWPFVRANSAPARALHQHPLRRSDGDAPDHRHALRPHTSARRSPSLHKKSPSAVSMTQHNLLLNMVERRRTRRGPTSRQPAC
jgi:hypothetical protein